MEKNELFNHKFTKGKRTYFFDINKSKQGDLYLKVSESKKTENGFEHHRLIIFNEDIQDFVEAFRTVLKKYKELNVPKVNRK